MAHNLRWMDNFTVEQAKAKLGWVPHPRRADRRHYDMLRELHYELKAKKARFDSFKPFMPFGVVHAVPGSLKNPVHGCTRDWVLFKLFDDRLREPPRNVVSADNPRPPTYTIHKLTTPIVPVDGG